MSSFAGGGKGGAPQPRSQGGRRCPRGWGRRRRRRTRWRRAELRKEDATEEEEEEVGVGPTACSGVEVVFPLALTLVSKPVSLASPPGKHVPSGPRISEKVKPKRPRQKERALSPHSTQTYPSVTYPCLSPEKTQRKFRNSKEIRCCREIKIKISHRIFTPSAEPSRSFRDTFHSKSSLFPLPVQNDKDPFL